MHIIVCLAKDGGMSFFKKRQSRDRILIEDIVRSKSGEPLYMELYSAALFCDASGIIASDTFLDETQKGNTYFCERALPALDLVSKITIYWWNRMYPSDMRFPLEVLSSFEKTECMEFVGSSHDCITKEVYERRRTEKAETVYEVDTEEIDA